MSKTALAVLLFASLFPVSRAYSADSGPTNEDTVVRKEKKRTHKRKNYDPKKTKTSGKKKTHKK